MGSGSLGIGTTFHGVRESGGVAGYGLDVGAVVGEFAWVVTGAWCDRADFVFPN
jgi:hypothetical protein